jgi:class 3 adenylate cyclase
MIHMRSGKPEEARAALRAALKHFDENRELVELAQTQLEIAHAHAHTGDPLPLVREAILDALATAESCRRAVLVGRIEEELRLLDPEAYWIHVYHRVRGRSVSEETTSLMDGVREVATVMFLDIKGSTEFARGRDPEEIVMTINQLLAELVNVLRAHDARVSVFRGDGFLAIVRGAEHATRAIDAGLAMFGVLDEFNQPRQMLQLPLFGARIGIATGEMFLGNLGTYDKMDFTAMGTTVNLGARLEPKAEAGKPCISRGTYDLVRERYVFKDDAGRREEMKGLGVMEMWDVVGRK